eukprot:scaffold1280_cov379-Prasinococcus_capsulatus_cf.AAC.24
MPKMFPSAVHTPLSHLYCPDGSKFGTPSRRFLRPSVEPINSIRGSSRSTMDSCRQGGVMRSTC